MAVEKNMGYGLRECRVNLTKMDPNNIFSGKKDKSNKVNESKEPKMLMSKTKKRLKQIETDSEDESENNDMKLKCVTVRKMPIRKSEALKEKKKDSEPSRSEKEEIGEKQGKPKRIKVLKNKSSENVDSDSEASENKEDKPEWPKKVETKRGRESGDTDNSSEASENKEKDEKEKHGRSKKVTKNADTEASENKLKRVEGKRGMPTIVLVKKAMGDKEDNSEISDNDTEIKTGKETRKTVSRTKKRKVPEDDSEDEEMRVERKQENMSDEEGEYDSSDNESNLDKLDEFKPKLLKCKKCKEKFKLYAAFERHQKVHQSLKFNCVLCGDKFNFRAQFLNHMNREHPEVELYPCVFPKCNASFDRKKKLQDHENSHFRYMCRFCKRRFGRRKMMQMHVQEIHF